MPAWPARIAAIVPVFDHAAQVGGVVASLRSLGAQVVVVDDGSTDGSGSAAAAAGATVVSLIGNRGKAAALRAGLAAVDGALAAVTVDADGQHHPDDALQLAHAAAADPEALHIGVRCMDAAPWSSRFGRCLSNGAVRLCCGARVGDSQSGLRAYPLPATRSLPARAERYAWEVEVLVSAVRAGIRVVGHPVSVAYPIDRVSHFGAVRDSLRLCGVVVRMALGR